MKKIEKLTPEQEAKFPEYVKKWIDIGINTEMPENETVEKIVENFRELIDFEKNVPLVRTKNPIEAWVMCCLLKKNSISLEDSVQEMEQVFNGNPKKRKIEKAILPFQSGSFFASTFSFYDYMFEVLGVELEKDLYVKYKKWKATSQIGCIYPFDDLTIICDKPIVCKLNEHNRIHCEDGPAVEYAGLGDLRIFALNGVVCPEYLVMTPAEELDHEFYNKEENADVKAEFVRKVGIEFFLDKGTMVDSYKNYSEKENPWWHKSQYELWNLPFLFPRLSKVLYLKMQNMTTGIWHVEAVSPNCETLQDAIKERFGGRDMKIISIA